MTKFSFNKGYSAHIQHFGTRDPLIGSWFNSRDNVQKVFKMLGSAIEYDWLSFMSDQVYKNFTNIDDALDFVYGVADSPEFYVAEYLYNQGLIIAPECLFGITDKDYFEQLLRESFYDDEEFYDFVSADEIEFSYK